jgi:hypothetical protein
MKSDYTKVALTGQLFFWKIAKTGKTLFKKSD